MSLAQRLTDTADVAHHVGWAVMTADLSAALNASRELHWTLVRTRQRDPDVSRLVPVDHDQARAASLSRLYGRDRFPLHTDGAHLREPPDVVVLACEHPSEVPTLLWHAPSASELDADVSDALDNGLFLVRGTPRAFITTVASKSRLRFDRGCMEPLDRRGNLAASFIEEHTAIAHAHAWQAPGVLLVIDNRRTLHGRPPVELGTERALRRAMFKTGDLA